MVLEKGKKKKKKKMTDPTTTTTANWLHETFKQSSDTIFQQTGKIN